MFGIARSIMVDDVVEYLSEKTSHRRNFVELFSLGAAADAKAKQIMRCGVAIKSLRWCSDRALSVWYLDAALRWRSMPRILSTWPRRRVVSNQSNAPRTRQETIEEVFDRAGSSALPDILRRHTIHARSTSPRSPLHHPTAQHLDLHRVPPRPGTDSGYQGRYRPNGNSRSTARSHLESRITQRNDNGVSRNPLSDWSPVRAVDWSNPAPRADTYLGELDGIDLDDLDDDASSVSHVEPAFGAPPRRNSSSASAQQDTSQLLAQLLGEVKGISARLSTIEAEQRLVRHQVDSLAGRMTRSRPSSALSPADRSELGRYDVAAELEPYARGGNSSRPPSGRRTGGLGLQRQLLSGATPRGTYQRGGGKG